MSKSNKFLVVVLFISNFTLIWMYAFQEKHTATQQNAQTEQEYQEEIKQQTLSSISSQISKGLDHQQSTELIHQQEQSKDSESTSTPSNPRNELKRTTFNFEQSETMFANEQPDVRATNNLTANLESSILSGELAGLTILSADCRTSICKLTLELENEMASEHFTSKLTTLFERPMTAEMQNEVQDNGKIITTMYLNSENQPSF